ncbi:MAG: glycosyltransferase [Burkholderiales bacterium]|nr:glycosyltransferase [Burkholderiales bacterium]
MKILYLNFDHGIPVLGDKGASVHVREFVSAASGLGHELVVVCARLGSGNAAPPAALIELAAPGAAGSTAASAAALAAELGLELQGAAAAPAALELAKLAYDRAVVQRVLDALAARAFRPDFVYERHALFSSAGARIAARCDCPRILEVNAPLAEEQKRFRGLQLEAVARRLEAESFASAAAVVAVSDAVRDYVLARAPLQQVAVEANGVDLERFADGAAGREAWRARIGVAAQTGVIGFVGSFKSWHGTELLFEVFSDIAARRDVHLLAVGDGPLWAEFQDRVARSPWRSRVTLPGRAPHADIPGWTAACDIIVAPYRAAEDFYFSPLKVIEALACGRPVVAPRIGQLPELIAHGRTGLLYRPDDAHDCRDALLALLDEPERRAALGQQALQSVAARGWDRIVERVCALARPARSGVPA